MEKRSLTCIICPIGCSLEVEMISEHQILVSGNRCPRGENYGKKEVTAPTRVVTTSVKVEGKKGGYISCKTKGEVPKDKVFDVVKEVKNITVKVPVYIGDILAQNIANTGIDLVATSNTDY